jgi:hypothetical protein
LPVDGHVGLSCQRGSGAIAIGNPSRTVMNASERAAQPNNVWITNREAL